MSGIVTAMPLETVDLLVIGPHPDDIEIGFGGSVALHVARGFTVGLCDLTRGELGSNGTVEERLAEAEAARAVLGAAWRINFGWPDGGLYDTPEHVHDVVRLVRTSGSSRRQRSLGPGAVQVRAAAVPPSRG
jgi:LmbE family N-acetylglucosaminyl deacetylase